MLAFLVLDSGGPATQWPLRKAYVFGRADELPVQAEVRFERGLIRCDKQTPDAAGLALQFPVDAVPGTDTPLGLLTLRTCLLPEREHPYLLTLELARHRIMLSLNKLEQWGLFDLPADAPALLQLDRARVEFTRALVALGDKADPVRDLPALLEADAAARRALALAVDASEQLTLIDAERDLPARLSGRMFEAATARPEVVGDRTLPEGAVKNPAGPGLVLPGAPLLGVAASPAAFAEPLCKATQAGFDFLVMPMRWVDMEPTEGKYAFTRTDRWIEWAVRTAKVPVHAGPLISFSDVCVPEWLYIWEHDYDTLRELCYEHIKNLVTRYRRTIARWTVCSGLPVNQSFALSVERMMDLTRMCVLLVRKLHPQAKVQIEITLPWGEYFARSRRSLPPKMYADLLGQTGVAIDALGLRVQMGHPSTGRTTRDLAQFSDLLDRYAEYDRPLSITLAAPSQPLPGEGDEGVDAGSWRSPWSPETQARWARDAAAIAASKPFVHSIVWQELYDAPGAETPSAGLFTDAGTPRPALNALAELRRAIQKRSSPAPVVTKP